MQRNKACCIDVQNPPNALLHAKAPYHLRERVLAHLPMHEHKSPWPRDIAGERC